MGSCGILLEVTRPSFRTAMIPPEATLSSTPMSSKGFDFNIMRSAKQLAEIFPTRSPKPIIRAGLMVALRRMLKFDWTCDRIVNSLFWNGCIEAIRSVPKQIVSPAFSATSSDFRPECMTRMFFSIKSLVIHWSYGDLINVW